MKLENQVCSLDLAKRLKELGVKQESQFYWTRNNGAGVEFEADLESRETIELLGLDTEHEAIISAFTVAELGEMLPDEFLTGKDNGVWYWALKGETNSERTANSEADARAKMLVYILKNNLIRLQ